MIRRLAPLLFFAFLAFGSSGLVSAQVPPMCDWVWGQPPYAPNQESNCNWINDASGGFPDYVQTYNGTQLPPGPGACISYTIASGFNVPVIANTACPHVFVPICQMINPYALSLPATVGPPAGLPSQYACVVYPNPTNFGPTNVSQYVTSCTPGPTPQASIDIYFGNNVGDYTVGHCARVTAPTYDNHEYYLDFHAFLANGWRSYTNAAGTAWIRSVQMGPHTQAAFSSNARVDLSDTWLCRPTPTNSKCRLLSNTSGTALESDHFYATDSSLEPNWKPWSMRFHAGP
jgi:hypothetical protein